MINPKHKRLLLCLYPFPPLGGPRAIRWLHLAKALSRLGWTVDVLTVQPSRRDSFFDESLLRELPPEINVFRTYPGLYYSLIHLRKKPIQGFPKTTMEWFLFGLKKGRTLMKSQDYSILISSGLPFVGHLVGYALKRRNQIPWVTDYGDPFSFNPMTSLTKRLLGGKLEKRMLKAIDGLIVPFEDMGKDFLDYFPFLDKTSVQTIKNGLPEKFDRVPPADFGDRFVISYVGSFYKKGREPFALFEAFGRLKDIQKISPGTEVIIAGNTQRKYIDYAEKCNIGDLVRFLGQVPYEKAISILKGSSVILYVGSRFQYHNFPYKVLECASAGRPILAMKQSSTDLGVDFIENHNLGITVSMEKESIGNAILELQQLWQDKKLETSFGRIDKQQHYWQHKGQELDEFLTKLLQGETA